MNTHEQSLRDKVMEVKYDLVKKRNKELEDRIFQLQSKIYYLRQQLGEYNEN